MGALPVAYRSFMSGCLISLDKQPVMNLVSVKETWRRLFFGIVINVTGPKAAIECQYNHLYTVLIAGIYGAIHGVQNIWDENSTMGDWLFLVVDAKNVFNDINWIGILWTVCHLWPSGACFVFNCYCQWLLIIFRNRNGTAIFMLSREGVTQGYPLSPHLSKTSDRKYLTSLSLVMLRTLEYWICLQELILVLIL